MPLHTPGAATLLLQLRRLCWHTHACAAYALRLQILGKGQLPAQPVVVRAKFVSKLAEKKILAAGGAVQLIA